MSLLQTLRTLSIHTHLLLTFLFSNSIQSSITSLNISRVSFSADDVLEALSHLKSGKSDGDGVLWST